MKVCFLTSEKIRPLRQIVLRPGKSYKSTSYVKDNDHNTFHLAISHENKILSCATFYPEKFPKKSKFCFEHRLRGMATHPKHRRQGYGKKIIIFGIKYLKEKACDLIWCNARLNAISFYKSLGFNKTGQMFDIKDIGPHYLMYLEI